MNHSPSSKSAVIVVHGMGEHKEDEFLLDVVNPIVRWLQHTGRFEVQVTPKLKKDSQQKDPSEVLLTTNDQSWVFMEAYWAESFAAPAFDPMVGWVFWRFLNHILNLGMTTALYTLIPALLGLFAMASVAYFGLSWAILGTAIFVYFLPY